VVQTVLTELVVVVQVDPARGSVGRLDHELYAAPECRVAVPDEPLPMHEGLETDYVTPAHVSLDLPRTMQGHKATDVWTMGVVFWQMVTLQPATGILMQVRTSQLIMLLPRRAFSNSCNCVEVVSD
jgi:hypothetical protein